MAYKSTVTLVVEDFANVLQLITVSLVHPQPMKPGDRMSFADEAVDAFSKDFWWLKRGKAYEVHAIENTIEV